MPPAASEFDRYADHYEEEVQKSIPSAFRERDYFALYKVEAMARRMAGERPMTILDFGCGVGTSLSLLRRAFAGSKLYGYDVSATSIGLARRSAPGAILTTNLDDVPVGGVDAILAANVFHHIPSAERAAALVQCRQRLRPGGRMFLFEHNPVNPLTRYVFERCPLDADAEMLHRREALALADAAELEIVRADYTLFFPRPLAFLRPLERLFVKIPLGAQYCVEMRRR